MANYQHRHSQESSALTTAITLLTRVCRTVKRHIGLVLIDWGMRTVVRWYDRRHSRPSARRQPPPPESDSAIAQYKNKLIGMKRQLEEQELTNKSLSAEIARMRKSLQITLAAKKEATDQIAALHTEISQLGKEMSALRKRCLPESEIPSLILYAQPDADGLNLRKVTGRKTQDHIYRLVTNAGDASAGEFEPIVDNSDMRRVITYRNTMLRACDIRSIAANASSIQTITPGRAVLDNNTWKVTNKAKIELI